MKKNLVDKNIRALNSSWSFGNKIATKFEKHIKQSVPLYEEGHDLILMMSDFFISEDSVVYDIGCSTGNLVKKISNRHKNKKFKIYAVDIEKEMITHAKKKNKDKKIIFLNKDISKYKINKCDLIISYYTMQFIKPKNRQLLFNKLFKSLNWGGALLIFEKVRANDARFQDIITSMYYSFKEDQGFLPEEIYNKTKSLKSILEPFSSDANIDMMKRSGFKDIMTLQKYICFEGWVAIK